MISSSQNPSEPTPRDRQQPPVLAVRDLRVWFPVRSGGLIDRQVGWIRAVDGLGFEIRRGETLGLVGESGSGKTTVGRAVVRLLRPRSGSIRLNGTELVGLEGRALREQRRGMQMVFQDPYESLDPRMTLQQLVSEPLDIRHELTAKERDARVLELLGRVGLNADLRARHAHEFSGGQRQRIGIARALALDPELVIADEPISSLDVSIQAQVINLLRRLQANLGLTYLLISHDLAVVRHISTSVAVMYLGCIVEKGKPADIYQRPLHPYTVALLSAVAVPDPKVEARRKRIILSGEIPSPASPPSGCRFHTRCWLRQKLGRPSQCEQVDPEPRQMASGHTVACHFVDQIERMEEWKSVTGQVAGIAPD